MFHRSSFFLAAALLLVSSSSSSSLLGDAFSLISSPSLPSITKQQCSSASPIVFGHISQLQMSAEDDEPAVGLPPLPSEEAVKKKEAVDEQQQVVQKTTTSYPIDLPSPILLALSMILAISSTGSLFELTGGTPPPLGFGVTAAIAAIGLPSSVFLIYAAILKGAAETEEADKEFNKPRRF